MNCPQCGRDHGDTTACPSYGGTYRTPDFSIGEMPPLQEETGVFGYPVLTEAQEERIRELIRDAAPALQARRELGYLEEEAEKRIRVIVREEIAHAARLNRWAVDPSAAP